MLAFIFVLGVMVVFHELGHYLAARYFKVKVESFAFGFGPRLFGFKRGGTDFKVCLLPLGGYVKMAGESIGEPSGDPDELLAKPRWQRFIIMAMGPIFNFILAIALLTGLFMNGFERAAFLTEEPRIEYIQAGTGAAQAGLQPGDVIRAIDGQAVATWQDVELPTAMALNRTVPVEVERGGLRQTFQVFVAESEDRPGIPHVGWSEGHDVVFRRIEGGSPGEAAGLQPGDRLRSLEGRNIRSSIQVVELIQESAGEPLQIEIERDGAAQALEIAPAYNETDDAWRIGVELSANWRTVQSRLGFAAALTQAVESNVRACGMLFKLLGGLFSGTVSPRMLSGPIGIYEYSKEAADVGLRALIELMALISMQLGIFNLFPIPILDGGQMLLLTFEGAMRRDVSIAIKERIIQVGLVLIVLLFGFVMYNDLVKKIASG